MKKLSIIFIAAAIAALLVACGSKVPSGMTQETYDNGCRALEIMEKYNGADITAEEAELRLKSIKTSLESETFTISQPLESANNTIISTNIFLFISALNGSSVSSTYDQEDSLRRNLEK